MKVLSEPGITFVRRNVPYGSEKELGMWPEERPERGSGSEPVYLQAYCGYCNGRKAIAILPSQRAGV